MKIAFVFPGQGSQHVGMGKDLYDNFPEVRKLYEEASDVLGYDVARLSFFGPQEELNKTIRTQPCLLLASISAYRVLSDEGISPSVVAGHSLGEYSALVASGVFSLSDALRVTEMRGKLMQEAVPEGKGLMAAVLGLERSVIDEVCREVRSGYVRAANYNCPGQIVISGERVAVEEAIEALMEGAAKKLSEFLFLGDIKMNDPKIPLVSNAEAIFLTSIDGIRASLVKQLSSAVLWEDSVREMFRANVEVFIEVGPGTVLSGLIRRIEPSAKTLNVQDSESLKKTLEILR